MSMERKEYGYGYGFGLGRLLHGGVKSHAAIFTAGLALGSITVKLLTSRDAREFYTKVIAAGLRAKEYTMDTVNNVQEHIEDMVAEAKFINDLRAEEEIYEYFDEHDCCCGDEEHECCCGDESETEE